MKRMIALVVVFGAFAQVALAEDIMVPIDFGTYEPTAAKLALYNVSTDDPSTWHTLSQDRDWTGHSIDIYRNSYFVFTNGNHTITGMGQPRIIGGQHVKSCIFRGGFWNFAAGTWFRCAGDGSTRGDGATVLFDGSALNLSRSGWLQGFYGANNTMIFTNKASLTYSTTQFFYSGSSTDMTNNLVHISSGSVVDAYTFVMENGNAGDSKQVTGNRIVVTGEGSKLVLNDGSYTEVSVGNKTSGNSLLADDNATVSFGKLAVGSADGTCSNRAEFVNGATLWTRQGERVGAGVGSDYNTLTFRNATLQHRTSTDDTYIGSKGSHNTFTFENSKYLGGMHGIHVGCSAGANHNVARFAGRSTEMTGSFGSYFFGQGQFNELVFDDIAAGNSSDSRINFSESAEKGTTNNTLKVINGATLKAYDFEMYASCVSNVVYIGADSTYTSGHDVRIRGIGNALVLSNGTFNLTQSGDNLRFGTSGSTVEVGNKLILQGSRPRLYYTGGTAFTMYSQSELIFDVPETGYDNDHPIFDGTGFQASWNTRIICRGIEKLQKRMQDEGIRKRDFILSSNNQFSIPDRPEGKTRADFFAKTEGLPKGCYLDVRSLGPEVERLVLHVKADLGTVLIVR